MESEKWGDRCGDWRTDEENSERESNMKKDHKRLLFIKGRKRRKEILRSFLCFHLGRCCII